MSEALKKLKHHKYILLLFLGALILRLIGIQHGFPFIFHPDEPAVVRSALGIRFGWNPQHFDWPHLFFYMNFFLFAGFIKLRTFMQTLGLQATLASNMPILWQDPLVFYLLSRILEAFMGALTVIPVYLAGKELFGNRAGYLAALTIALMPFHVHASHFALIDIPTAFWISWSIYFSAKIFKEGIWKDYAWAGLFIGLAASTKYHGGLAALVVATAHFARVYKNSVEKFISIKGIKQLIVSGLASIVGFFIGTPFALFDYKTFSRTDRAVGAFWQFENVGSVDFTKRLINFGEVLTTKFFTDFGPTFLAVFLIYIAYTLFVNRDRRASILLIPSLFIMFYVSGFEKVRVHYFLPAYPFMALAVGAMVAHIISLTRSHYVQKLVYLAVFLVPIFYVVNVEKALVLPDTRQELYTWLETNTILTDKIVYNSSSLAPVIDKISKDRSSKGINKDNFVGKVGYIVIYKDPDETAAFLAGKDEDSYVPKHYQIFKMIDSTGRRGGNIFIYKLGK